MNWDQSKDPYYYLCLYGAVVACWFITPKLGGLNTPFAKIFFYRFCRLFRIHLGKTRMCLTCEIHGGWMTAIHHLSGDKR